MNARRLVSVACLLTILAGCSHPRQASLPVGPPSGPAGGAQQAEGSAQVTPASYQRDPNNPFQQEVYSDPTVTASIPDYKVDPGFSNVANWKQFASAFDAQQRDLLAKNLFIVLPADRHQMSFIYEENNYTKGPKDPEIPSFVTTDSTLHTFHVYYDYMLRTIENGPLYDAASDMTLKLLDGTLQQYEQSSDPTLHEAALKNIAYLLVPARALQVKVMQEVPQEATALADKEWALIQAHQGKEQSPIFGYAIDYSMFVPRGHYTRNEKLKRYFVAVMWYGTAPLLVRDDQSNTRPEQIRQAALLGELLTTPAGQSGSSDQSEQTDSSQSAQPGMLWRRIYEPTAFMVGISDDMTPSLFKQVVDKAAGAVQDLADDSKMDAVVQEAEKRSPSQIVNLMHAGSPNKEIPVKLMGQRFVADSFVFQQLMYPSVGDARKARMWPFGLDLLAALGNDRALDILHTDYLQGGFANYDAQMQKMRDFFKNTPPDRWQENAYWGWLDVLRRVVEPKPKGYPSFMQAAAWQDKSLNTALGSWAELRHDTLLYAKQSTAECGEGGEDEENRPPRGYVEPDVKTYSRLRFLHTQLWKGLKARKLLSENLDGKCRDFDELLGFLVTASQKELQNQPLSREEEEEIHNYGDTMSRLNIFTQELHTKKNGEDWSEITSETDKDMAVAADVHTNNDEQKVLEVAAGHANEIYVVFPAKGKLWIGRGAVFSYYEFKQPMDDRLTDEKWQQMLSTPSRPSMQNWIKSFFSEKGAKLKERVDDRILEDTRSTGGC